MARMTMPVGLAIALLFVGVGGSAWADNCAVQSPGTGLSCPTHVSTDERSGGENILIAGYGDNRIHLVCRSPHAGICAELANAGGALENVAPNSITPIAGTGWPVNSGDGQAASSAGFYQPSATALDSFGNIVIASPHFHSIRVVCVRQEGVCGGSTDGIRLYARGQDGGGSAIQIGHVYHLAGAWSPTSTNPNFGFGSGSGCQGAGDGVDANQSCLNEPYGVAVSSADNVLIADTNNNRVRIVCMNPQMRDLFCAGAQPGSILTLAGGAPDTQGDGTPASRASLSSPISIAIDSKDNVAIADGAHFKVRIVCSGTAGLCRGVNAFGMIQRGGDPAIAGHIYTAAGTGIWGSGEGDRPSVLSRIGSIGGLGFDSADNLLISDSGNASVAVVCADATRGACAHLVTALPGNLYQLGESGTDSAYVNSNGYFEGALAVGSFGYPMHARGYSLPGRDQLVITDRDNGIVRVRFY